MNDRPWRQSDPPEIPATRVILLIIGFAVALGTLLLFGALTEDIFEHETVLIDQRASLFVHGFATPWLDQTMHVLSIIGSWQVLIGLVLGSVALLVRVHRRHEALFLILSLGGGALLNMTIKLVVQRPRPTLPWSQIAVTYSFPSGHAMNSLIFYLSLALVAWSLWGRRLGLSAVLLAALLVLGIGLSRIYLGVHYLSDVVGGYIAGIFWLTTVILAFETRRMRAR